MRSKIEGITGGNSKQIYRGLLDAVSDYGTPHEFVGSVYSCYLAEYGNKNPSTNGRIFEYLICETLAQSGIVPFYYQAKFDRVPNADFDVVLYDPKKPVALTMKVSLRERYKQADLEGNALRQVYRLAKSYLITLSVAEAPNIVNKIANGDIAGLDKCVLADQPEYTELLADLLEQQFHLASAVMPLSGNVIHAPNEE